MSTSSLLLSQQLLIGELLKQASHKTPNKESFVYEEERLTYKQMDDRATHLAGWLQSKGIKKNDKVGFILKNGLPFVEVFFGVSMSGGVGVPINFRLAANELEYIINNSDSKILIIDNEFAEVINSIRNKIPKVEAIIIVNNSSAIDNCITYSSIFGEASIYTPCEDLTDNDPGMIVYTSGTTGKPKGAVLTHKNLCINRLLVIWETKTPLYAKQLIIPPLFHVAAMAGLIKNCLINGTAVIQRNFDPEDTLLTIEKEKINSLMLVPAMWNSILQVSNLERYDLSSVIECSSGGAVCPLELKKKIMSTFKNASYNESLGQTEMSPAATSLNNLDVIRKTKSVGKPILGVEARIVDENMNDVPVGEVGEIVYRGPSVMKEYYNNPEGTKEAFKGGWFHSGDIVRADEEGFIYIVDRKKDMLISGGENIYPIEIEEVLHAHPSILECAIVGVPDINWGESVKAFIVLRHGKELSAEEVIEYCTEHLASYKKPKFVEFVDQLPRNASGKIMKQVLRECLMKTTKS
ncbi:acyl-CoA synthetase [Sporosarcina sp. P13]|uniref:class I adenylate-forming enzyme family protein n=1 Tax=Sporosarcina sp. P13 TaxID=2048263 RepID=UPI000C162D10|nr:long-chain fatty acid--CoA ligase [Sporosarcina sp. P13]PIC62780.1 acyl-CoA synthetase [Sporosarcina sp. P13]